MRDERGKIEDQRTLTENLELRGQWVGDCVVPNGLTLILRGQVTGNLFVEVGGRADVRGMVGGSLSADGEVHLYGMVIGTANGDGLTAEPGSVIDGKTQ